MKTYSQPFDGYKRHYKTMELGAKQAQDMDISRPSERATCISLFEQKVWSKRRYNRNISHAKREAEMIVISIRIEHMLVLNFTHPLTVEQCAQIEALAQDTIAEVRTIYVQINHMEPLGPQITT